MRRTFSILLALVLVLGFSLTMSVSALAVVLPVHNVTQDTYYATIQAAINAANSGDTIMVATGTYAESVTIDKNNLTLTGDVASRPAITGGLKLDTNLAGLTLQNFYITGTVAPQNSLVRMYGVITDLAVDNCVFDGENTASRMGFTGGQIEGDLTVSNSEFKNIVGWAVLDTRSGSGGDGSAMGTVTFANNNVHDCDGSIVFRGLSTDWTDNVYIYDNTFQNIGEEGVSEHWAAFEVNRAASVEIHDNEIRSVVEGLWGEGQAMQLWMVGTVSIYNNTVEDNYMGIAVLKWPSAETYDVSGISIHYNDFSGNDQYGLSVDDGLSGGPVDATYNWWGADDGPSGVGPGTTGDAVSTYVNYVPWATKTATGAGNAYITPSAGTITGLTGVTAPAGAPVSFPYGMFSFVVTGITGQVTLTIELPGSVPVGTKWYKYNGGAWDPMDIGDDDGDNIVTVTLRDNMSPDDEDVVLGQITDQGGPGSPAVGWETYPVDRARVLLPWLALVLAIAAGASLLVFRRRQTKT